MPNQKGMSRVIVIDEGQIFVAEVQTGLDVGKQVQQIVAQTVQRLSVPRCR